MMKFTHVKCVYDVIEDGIVIFKSDGIYKIVGFDYHSFVYYVEPEYYADNPLPDEFAISALNHNFNFLVID